MILKGRKKPFFDAVESFSSGDWDLFTLGQHRLMLERDRLTLERHRLTLERHRLTRQPKVLTLEQEVLTRQPEVLTRAERAICGGGCLKNLGKQGIFRRGFVKISSQDQ